MLTDQTKIHESESYDYVDWSKTKAFALGLNGIYINLLGREITGSVSPYDFLSVKEEIRAKLADVRDPKTGSRIITQAYDSHRIYTGPYVDLAPDIMVRYQSGYRISDEAVLGKFPQGIVGDRTDKWAADAHTRKERSSRKRNIILTLRIIHKV